MNYVSDVPPGTTRVPLVCLVDSPAVAAAYRRWMALPAHPLVRLVWLDVAEAATIHHPAEVPGVDGPYGLVAAGAAAGHAYRLAQAQREGFPIFKLFLLGPPAVPLGKCPAAPSVTVLIGADSLAGSPAMGWLTPVDDSLSVRVVGRAGTDPLGAAPAEILQTMVEELWLWPNNPGPSASPAVPARSAGQPTAAAPAPPLLDPPGGSRFSSAVTQVAEVASALTLVPNAVRRFDAPMASVWAKFRLTPELLSAAIAAGLPHLSHGDGILFDRTDLTNLALCPALRTPQRAVLSTWLRVLQRPAGERRIYEVAYHAPCPMPGHGGRCVFELRLPGDRVATVRAEGSGRKPLARSRVQLDGDWPELPPAVSELVAELAGIRFMRMHHGIRWDTAFVRRHWMGDCAGISRLTVEEGMRRGLTIRAAYGLIVAAPYATPHYWPETLVEGRWTPCDPGLRDGLVRWGVIGEGVWPTNRSFGPLLARLSTRYGHAVVHGQLVANTSFSTRLLAP